MCGDSLVLCADRQEMKQFRQIKIFLSFINLQLRIVHIILCNVRHAVSVSCNSFHCCILEWISVDKDETGGPKGKSTMVSRAGHEYVKSVQSTLFFSVHILT